MVRVKGLAVGVLLVGLSLCGVAVASTEEGGCLNGEWLLIMHGTQCCAGACLPEPYCVVARIASRQAGDIVQWVVIDGAADSLGSVGGKSCCEEPSWTRLAGFVGCGRLWMTSSLPVLGFDGGTQVVLNGRVAVLSLVIWGEFAQVEAMLDAVADEQTVLPVGGNCAAKGCFIAIKIGKAPQ